MKGRWEHISEWASQELRLFVVKIGILYLIYRWGEDYDGKRIRDAEMDIVTERGPKGRREKASGGVSLLISQKESTMGAVVRNWRGREFRYFAWWPLFSNLRGEFLHCKGGGWPWGVRQWGIELKFGTVSWRIRVVTLVKSTLNSVRRPGLAFSAYQLAVWSWASQRTFLCLSFLCYLTKAWG